MPGSLSPGEDPCQNLLLDTSPLTCFVDGTCVWYDGSCTFPLSVQLYHHGCIAVRDRGIASANFSALVEAARDG